VLPRSLSGKIPGGRAAEPFEPAHKISGRSFIQAGAAAGGGLILSLRLPIAGGEAEAGNAETFAPNAFIRIDGEGQIVLTMPYVETGQGTYTSIAMLIAEELEVTLSLNPGSVHRQTFLQTNLSSSAIISSMVRSKSGIFSYMASIIRSSPATSVSLPPRSS
jgi:hypothetical protein